MEAELAQLITKSSTNSDEMKNEVEFLKQAKHAQEALEQFNAVLNDPRFATNDLMKAGAMENVMKQTVRILRSLILYVLSEVLLAVVQ
jgi:hypothetical protein